MMKWRESLLAEYRERLQRFLDLWVKVRGDASYMDHDDRAEVEELNQRLREIDEELNRLR